MEVSVIGLGNRGFNYIRWIKYFEKDVSVVAVCDKVPEKTDYTAEKFKIPQKFYDEDEFFKEKRGDSIIIASQDRDHVSHAEKAILSGYKNILVEKPVSPDISECERLDNLARENGVTIVVCHVLRYSKYYRKIKEIIKSGVIGDVVNIQHSEGVGYFHFAHSYVRGNWKSSTETSPFLLAKCCHDFDILCWLVDKPPKAVSSFGSLKYFKPENAPSGSAERCVDCKIEDCPYNAEKLYLSDPFYKATFVKYSGSVLTNKYTFSKKEKIDAIKHGDYGKCVFKSDNDVFDHQVVNLLFSDGTTASHTVNAFTDKFLRKTVVFGTKGEIEADDLTGKIKVSIFHNKRYTVSTKLIKGLGHVDGDINIIKGWCKLVKGEPYDKTDVTFLSETIKSHKAVMYAQESAENGGKLMEFDK